MEPDGRGGEEKLGEEGKGGKYLGYYMRKKYPFSVTENKITDELIKQKENVH